MEILTQGPSALFGSSTGAFHDVMKTARPGRHGDGVRAHLHLRPVTRLGRWSIGLVGLFFMAFIVMVLVVGSGQQGGETFSDNWWISGPAFTAVAGAIGALVTGVIALALRGERALAVIFAVVVGALVTWFVLGEIIAPH
jgi:hypothetical protein